MTPEGKTSINLKFSGSEQLWIWTVSKTEQGHCEQWRFELDHNELCGFRDGLIDMIDEVEQKIGAALRDE